MTETRTRSSGATQYRHVVMAARRVAAVVGALAVVSAIATACASDSTVAPPSTGCQIPASVVAAGHKVVEIRGYAYSPALVRVSAGETVTWVNCEPPTADQHTATSDVELATPGVGVTIPDLGLTKSDAGLWSSGYFGPGAHYSRTFSSPGTFLYHCEPHPAMKGAVLVE